MHEFHNTWFNNVKTKGDLAALVNPRVEACRSQIKAVGFTLIGAAVYELELNIGTKGSYMLTVVYDVYIHGHGHFNNRNNENYTFKCKVKIPVAHSDLKVGKVDTHPGKDIYHIKSRKLKSIAKKIEKEFIRDITGWW